MDGSVDELTGLRNQRALLRELGRRAVACSPGAPLCVVMLDLDLMAEVNERYGHAVGDRVLRAAAEAMRRQTPAPRLAYRYGGEEFVLLLPLDEDTGRAVAERVRLAVAGHNGDLPAVTVSCGVAAFQEPAEPWVALDRAHAALRAGKRAGRNRVAVAEEAERTGNSYLVEELQQETARRAALAVAVATLEARDRGTADHSDDVVTLCETIGEKLGFEGPELEILRAGAQLHDVGKVAVPSAILNKPGPLDDEEWAVIRQHTVVGERILRSVPEMAAVATAVRHSHEHWDGGGYPDGLSGHDIPLASRVILCADAFHAMRADRAYRKGRPAADAIAELRKCAGTQFDPVVVEALVEVAEELRRQRESGAVGAALPRSRRLAMLLATLALGSGTAIAASPDVRDVLRSFVGAAAPAPDAAPAGGPVEPFGFGPLGDRLSIAPTVVETAGSGGRRAVVPRALAVRRGGGGVGSAAPSPFAPAVGESPPAVPTGTSAPTPAAPGRPDRGGAGTQAPPQTTAPHQQQEQPDAAPDRAPGPAPPADTREPGRPDSPGRSEDAPAHGQETAPGRQEDPAPAPAPEAESPGQSNGNGNSENAGPPADVGRPEDPGAPGAEAPGRGNGNGNGPKG